MNSLLMIDDDIDLCTALHDFVKRHDIRLDIRHTGDSGVRAAEAERYDLILLDVMLPDFDGFEILQKIRAFDDVSVMMLTARSEPADRVRGLQLGADDYLPKPFDPDELVARIRAILRRRTLYFPKASAKTATCLRVGDLVMDLTDHSARYGETRLNLTDIEFALLKAFMQSPGVVLEREELMLRIFERPFHPLNRTLDMHVSRLRRKLYSATTSPNLIKTLRSIGYLFSTIDLQRLDIAAS